MPPIIAPKRPDTADARTVIAEHFAQVSDRKC